MQAGSSGKGGEPKAKAGDGKRLLRRWGIVALVLVVGLVVWIVTGDDDSGSDSTEPQPAAGFAPRIVSEAELAEIAASAGHQVYWAGPPPSGERLEASESGGGEVTVRYLGEDEEPGGDPEGTVTIGTYPVADATAALDGYAEREGSFVRRASDGRRLVSSVKAPSSVYFASPDGSLQVEVYAPSPKRALALARSEQVQPVG